MAKSPKTQPTTASVDDYLQSIENDQRRTDAQSVIEIMSHAAGEPAVMWGDAIVGFGSYVGPTGPWPLIGLSARKTNLVLYISTGFEGREALVEALGKVKTGVGCIYVNRLDQLDVAALRRLCVQSVQAQRDRYPG